MKIFRLCVECVDEDGIDVRLEPVGQEIYCEVLEKRGNSKWRKHQYYSKYPFVVVVTEVPDGGDAWDRAVKPIECDAVADSDPDFNVTLSKIKSLQHKTHAVEGSMEVVDVTEAAADIRKKIDAAFEKFKQVISGKQPASDVDLTDLTKFPPPSNN